jgi:choline dehydrogenase-like flavoprotein
MSTDHAAADVVIVGAGASGAAAAWFLARKGHRVVVLEQGDWTRPEDVLSDQDDWEYHRFRTVSPNPNVRAAPADYPIVDTDTPIRPLLFNGVGGSTVLWSSHFPRFHPDDFRVRTLDGVADDWPVSYAELTPYFELNDRMMGVSGLSGDPAHPPRSARQSPPVPLGRGGARLADAFDRLGWHWWPADTAVNSRSYRGRGACNACGPCELGCPNGSKASVDVTYWPDALRAGAELITHARVREITVRADGRASGVAYIDRDGQERHQAGAAVMLAANAIGTARLLLLSRSAAHPDGIGNAEGQVGRHLMHHPIATVTGVFDERLDGHEGTTACSIMSMQFYGTQPGTDFVRGYKLQALRSHGPAVTAAGGFGLDIPWGPGHHARFDELFARTVSLTVTAEDLPDPDNRVMLDPVVVDGSGVAAPSLHYRVSQNSRGILDHGIARASEVMDAAGAEEIIVSPLLEQGGFHLMGTARMGTDPTTSVVDRYGRVHGAPNVLVVEGGTFTTGGAMNPTSTIQAVALWVADHLDQHGPHGEESR